MPGVVVTILDQTVGSTNVDSQGERIPKHILEGIAKNDQTILYQNHQPEKPSIGYMNNFKVVPDPKVDGEWLLKADIYFYEKPEDVEIALGGFSWSLTELIEEYKTNKTASYAMYLPWPYYNDKLLLDELRNTDESLVLGRWYKKSADPTTISLIVCFVLFGLSPAWDKFFNEVLWPKLSDVFSSIPKLRKKGMQRADLIQIAEIKHHQVNIYFIPEAGKEATCYSKNKLKQGFKEIYEFSENDPKAVNPGYQTVKLYWNADSMKYRLFHIELKDGTAINVIGKNM